jgi:ATP-dependent exoDNAse (exonuclease V) beta subunit
VCEGSSLKGHAITRCAAFAIIRPCAAATGHLDFLQVRNGAVHILDYKPNAGTNKPIAQLTIYALALTRLVPGLRLFDIKCAWFNEYEYCEMFPRTLFAR